jgi:Flp pilus assembly pilin Flp
MLGIFRGRDDGQDLAEYCLLTALIALIALGLFCYASGGIQGIWSSTGTALAAGAATTGANGVAGANQTTTNQPAGR